MDISTSNKVKKPAAKCIMVQGTGSSVGKSVIAAGLCRIFRQDGYRVAPFKSQNMALNSYITRDGKEMGRAQVVQAEAAGIEPSVAMNPILLKPTTDRKSQVILNGEVFRNMSASEYQGFKPKLALMVREAYEKLAEQNDIVVIEGAGSPAEINLRENDIVNMGMAEMADAPVILAGDIDRGGVFAALAGTLLLLAEEERDRVKGVVINKFRGDIDILKPGLQMLEAIIHIPVLGVMPYVELNIDDEDSLAERFSRKNGNNGEDGGGGIDVAVVRLPHISNFSDFNALDNIRGVRVRYIERPSELNKPDLIVLPGTKNTLEDLAHIRKIGLEEEIKRLNREGTVVFGICGGYQMLGTEILDPFQVESELQGMEGMGLLNARTVFQQEKVTTRAEGEISGDWGILQGLKGMRITGYEIHMGTTEYMEGCIPYLTIPGGQEGGQAYLEGMGNKAGTVFGTYLHGIFDNLSFTSGFLNNLRESRGKSRMTGPAGDFKEYKEYKEQQYDKLAELIRSSLDMDRIYGIMGLRGKERKP